MKLTITQRDGSESNGQLRRKDKIPAVLYGRKDEALKILIDGAEFSAFMRSLKKGHLPNTVFELNLGSTSVKAIIKDIQYHRVNYGVLHLDFMRLYEDVSAKLNIPVEMYGVEDCVGVKAGGVLRQVKRHVRVKCLPKAIPSQLNLDVSKIDLNGSARLSEVKIPEGVECLGAGLEVIAVVGKR